MIMRFHLTALVLGVFFAAPALAAKLTEEQAVEKAQAAIIKGHWTSLATECLSFEPTAPQWSFVVREEHNNICGGDSMTAPRLFNVQVNPQTGVVTRQD